MRPPPETQTPLPWQRWLLFTGVIVVTSTAFQPWAVFLKVPIMLVLWAGGIIVGWVLLIASVWRTFRLDKHEPNGPGGGFGGRLANPTGLDYYGGGPSSMVDCVFCPFAVIKERRYERAFSNGRSSMARCGGHLWLRSETGRCR